MEQRGIMGVPQLLMLIPSDKETGNTRSSITFYLDFEQEC